MALSRRRPWPAAGLASMLIMTAVAAMARHDGAVRLDAVRAAAVRTVPADFKHPGVLVTKEQLDVVRQRIAQGAQPWKSAFEQMRTSKYASLRWGPRPRARVDCGSYSHPNNGCSDEWMDAQAAYTDALMWYITQDARYAEKSIAIMDAWSETIKEHTNSNAPLQTGWAAANWSRAGELIRHTYGRWPAANRFASMLRIVYMPLLVGGQARMNGNWELIMTDALIGISVFLDDHAAFNKSIALWRRRLPEYIYLTSDGKLPKAPRGIRTKAQIIRYWQGQKTFVDGIAQETCRDFGHTGWGLEAAMDVAETAGIQGRNLYKDGEKRLTTAMEFHAHYQLGAKAPAWLCGGSPKLGLGPVFEVGYNAYRGRLDVSLPETRQYVMENRPAGANHFFAWETLTHASEK